MKFLKWIAIRLPLWISIVLIFLLFAEYGYSHSERSLRILEYIKVSTVFLFLICKIIYYARYYRKQHLRTTLFDALVGLYIIFTLLNLEWINYVKHPIYLYLGAIAIFIRELGTNVHEFTKRKINPALLFAISFLLIILLGTFALMLPKATYSGISFIDAIFTSTSAVCVTGLIVVDTGSYFTQFGQVIIITLIQMGGLGIMTFTTFFSFFFQGTSSFADQILIRDITNMDDIGTVLGTLTKIIYVTFIIELAGAVLIYSLLPKGELIDFNTIFFAIFHSISAFCNAGFSTLSQSLNQPGFDQLYFLHFLIAFLFILGGLGFPLIFNLFKYLRHKLKRLFIRDTPRQVWLINLNSRLIITVTAILLISGTLLFLAFEWDNTLDGKPWYGKVVSAFFGAATPRTAGFNTIDTCTLTTPAIMLTIFLMWVGASPGSTGGGIKTTTLAVAFGNFISLAQGKERIEIMRREISSISVRRAFAVIVLSLGVIFSGAGLINMFDPGFTLKEIFFESFSAYSTVGLSLGITAGLSTGSKMVIIFMMFTGRVGTLTLLVALFRKVVNYSYRYPKEDILIN